MPAERLILFQSAEQIQLQGRDYRSAWRSLDQANRVDPDSVQIRSAQEKLAMDWLENGRQSAKTSAFSDIAEKLEPVLTRGVAAE